MSGTTLDEARSALDRQSTTWEVTRREQLLLPSGSEISFVEARIDDFSDLGFEGELVLWFYQDQLTQTVFYPDDFDGYLGRLEGELGVSLRDSDGLQVGDSWIWAWHRKGDSPIVGWRDISRTDRFSPSS